MGMGAVANSWLRGVDTNQKGLRIYDKGAGVVWIGTRLGKLKSAYL